MGVWNLSRSFSFHKPVACHPLKIAFFGNDTFSLASLRKLYESANFNRYIKCLDVITSIKYPKNPVESYAKANNLNVLNYLNFKQNWNDTSYDMGLIVSFGHLIPERIINHFPLGMFNVHASLLPELRGAAPIIYAIRNRLSHTGVTIMKVQPHHFDTGEIISQRKVVLNDDDTFPDLRDRLSIVGGEELLKFVETFPECLQHMRQQDSNLATYAPKIDNNFTKVKWNEMTAQDVLDLHRSLFTFKPITMAWHGEPVKIHQVSLSPINPQSGSEKSPGSIKYSFRRKSLLVTCADQQEIEVLVLGFRKKNQISAADFYNGFVSKRPVEEHYFS